MDLGLQELEQGLAAVAEYDRNLTAQEEAGLCELARSLDPVAAGLDRLEAEHETYLKATKGRFNIFTVLLGIGDETRLHSRWLAYLLDPNGLHDCGGLFLKLFIQQIRQGAWSHAGKPDDQPTPVAELDGFDCANALVQKEVEFNEGRLDIVIRSPGSGIIAIENKIWAGEQYDQLERYLRYLQTQRNDGKSILFYLTLDGKPSGTAGDHKYRRISYERHILPWLDACLRETYQHVNINQALQQYRNVVAQITGGLPLEKEYMEKVTALLKKHPSVIRHLAEINSCAETLRQKYWNDFFVALDRNLQNNGQHARLESEIQRDEKHYPHAALKYDGDSFGPAGLQLTVEYGGVNRPKPLYIGLTTKGQKLRFPADIKEKAEQFHSELQTLLGKLESNWWWYGIYGLWFPDFSDEGLAGLLADNRTLDDMAAKTADAIKRYIESAESVWRKLSPRST